MNLISQGPFQSLTAVLVRDGWRGMRWRENGL